MLTQVIKKICSETLQSFYFVEIKTGTVIARDKDKYPKVMNDSTFIIKVDDKLFLDIDFLAFTKTSAEFDYDKGDSFVLLREQGGQKFLVLDEIYLKD